MLGIRAATEADHDAIWDIFHAIVAAGDTYAFELEMSRQEGLAYWFRADTRTYVAENDGRVVGTYILKPNQAAAGSHVANAAFMVAPDTRGVRVGRKMGEHCLCEARRLGFNIVGTLPGAFRHPEKGYVDVYIMFRSLL